LPFAAGLTLDFFHAQSTDGDWKETFVKLQTEIIHKLVTLRDLSLYWDNVDRVADRSGSIQLQYKDRVEMARLMDDLMVPHPPPSDSVVTSGSQPGGRIGGVSKFHHYILNPISGLLKLTLSNSTEFKIDVPKTQLDLELEAVRLGLNRVQFSTILDAIDYMTAYNKNVKYLKFRPKDGITPRENPRAWWRYVINSVRQTIHERNEQWTWSHMMEWKKDRQSYIDLYKERKLGKRKLKPQETAELDRLEVKHSYKTLLTWRRLANAAIDLRKLKKKETKEKEKSASREKRKALVRTCLVWLSKANH
jgi:vacuolar protein sorting-associated protein 13A/C